MHHTWLMGHTHNVPSRWPQDEQTATQRGPPACQWSAISRKIHVRQLCSPAIASAATSNSSSSTRRAPLSRIPWASPGNTKQLLACAGLKVLPLGLVTGAKGEPPAYTAAPEVQANASLKDTSAWSVGLDRAKTRGRLEGPPTDLVACRMRHKQGKKCRVTWILLRDVSS